MTRGVNDLVGELTRKYEGKVETSSSGGEPVIFIAPEHLLEVIGDIKGNADYDFKMLADLTAVENLENITMVYQVMSMGDASILRIEVKLDKNAPKVPSIVSLWAAANVQERETFDLMGVEFEGHPNLKRILCPDDFNGHPLRKDYVLKTRLQ